MDARDLFMLRYEAIHDGFVTELFSGSTEDQARERPHGVNSIVWLVWHMARVEDAVLNRFVADRPQVLDDDGSGAWASGDVTSAPA